LYANNWLFTVTLLRKGWEPMIYIMQIVKYFLVGIITLTVYDVTVSVFLSLIVLNGYEWEIFKRALKDNL